MGGWAGRAKLQPKGQWAGCWVALRKDGPKLGCLEGQEGTDKRMGDEEEWDQVQGLMGVAMG